MRNRTRERRVDIPDAEDVYWRSVANDLSGWPATITGWGSMAGNDSSGHVLRVDRHR